MNRPLHASRLYWDQRDLTELLALDADGQHRYRSHACELDADGRVHGGQLIAQALWAAAQSAGGYSPSMLQSTFLHDADPRGAVEYSVEVLQDDRCLSNRHVYAVQGTGLVLSANASFRQPSAASGRVHHLDRQMPVPEALPTLAELAVMDPQSGEGMRLRMIDHPVLDVRPIPLPLQCEWPAEHGETAFWVRLKHALPGEGCLHHAALAYMSDCRLARWSVPSAMATQASPHCRVSNLNHTLWFHSPAIDANDWLLFLSDPVLSLSGRNLVNTRIYQRYGRLVASRVQDLWVEAATE
ncbi:thioesterase family protein [Pseudomonas sp. SZMC_28357]|uniref:acyl-CoA thioesterase n=1 Tax=Pseudomonas sp. SZMC_28357 TaxID=3074380 RepID=UPI0028712D31|nr:acyl-CoA thioesterase domain-containing protein [Pseudomonas sp. SZMC_28357]MDR9752514.1 thioesterase family protein [Pseudomonas sp. SZMC_28357]